MTTSNLTMAFQANPRASVYLRHVICVILSAISCAATPVKVPPPALRLEFSECSLGTTFRIVVYCPDQLAAGRAQSVVRKRIAQLEHALDTTKQDSEISQVYVNAGLGAVRVSDDLFALVRQADRFSVRSNGGYDVSAGALAELWRTSFEAETLPAQEKVDAAKLLAGRKKVRIDPINRTIHLIESGMRLDLESFSQAYVCDRLLSALREAKLASALIDSGASIAVGEPPPGRKGWRIRLDDADTKSSNRFVLLARQAIASSSHLGDHITVADQAFSRLLFPPSGLGSRNTAPTTVVAPRALQAALLARITSVNGETAGQKLIASMPVTRIWYHYPPGQRPQTQPAGGRPRGMPPQSMPSQWKTRAIKQEGFIRQ